MQSHEDMQRLIGYRHRKLREGFLAAIIDLKLQKEQIGNHVRTYIYSMVQKIPATVREAATARTTEP
jgi:hypothetical protein